VNAATFGGAHSIAILFGKCSCSPPSDPTAWGDWSQVMATAEIAPTRIAIDHVLIATDFSQQSELALQFGMDFALLFGANAEIAYVLPTEQYVLAGGEGLLAGRDAVRSDLLALKAKLRRTAAYDDDTECQVTMLEGPVADSLLDCAHEKRADLIVVGTHGRGGLGKAFLGSVAERIFRHSSVPVLTIGPNIHRRQRPAKLRHILAPCDLAATSHPAVHYACALAASQHTWLTVLHVVDQADEGMKIDTECVKAGIRERLTEIVGDDGAGLEVNYRVEVGRVASMILEVAAGANSDLIVLGVRPSTGMFDRFAWPVAYELVCGARCPVLTIRQTSPLH
jgi:nucleotide-binding universal stress UspA family protein